MQLSTETIIQMQLSSETIKKFTADMQLSSETIIEMQPSCRPESTTERSPNLYEHRGDWSADRRRPESTGRADVRR
jgi:hypothetical protein